MGLTRQPTPVILSIALPEISPLAVFRMSRMSSASLMLQFQSQAFYVNPELVAKLRAALSLECSMSLENGDLSPRLHHLLYKLISVSHSIFEQPASRPLSAPVQVLYWLML